MPKQGSESPESRQLAERENSACSVDTVESFSGKEGKSRDKGKHKGGDLNKLFSLPESEVLVDDFICALRRKALYQGRMYIFDHYLCFYSKIFNHQKIVSIPLKEVTQIRKKKHYGFSNSLNVVWKGKRDTFTSFLKRDQAYKILSYAWSKSTPYAKLFGGVPEEGSNSAAKISASDKSDSKKILGSARLANLVHKSKSDAGGGSRHVLYEESSEDEDTMYMTGEAGDKSMRGSDLPSHHDSDSDAESDSTDVASEATEEWKAVSTPPPPPSPQATLLIETELDTSVRDFYKEVLSDQSQFFVTWHEARGDTEVHLSKWSKHAGLGFVRELTFITPLKQRIGPSKCLCTQTQKVRLHPKDHLLFETSQIMDIPYGDYFSVETRWDYTPKSSKKCKVESRLSIPFSKKTMFKNTIESSTKQLCKEANEDWVKAAKRWLEPPIPISPSAPPSAFADDSTEASSPDKTPKKPTHFSRADSLRVRMSSESMLPDAEVLNKAPTAYRSDIARVLQLQKRDSQRQSRLNLAKSKSSQYEDERSGKLSRVVGLLRSHVGLTVAVLVVLLLQLVYILWRHSGSSDSNTYPVLPAPRASQADSFTGSALVGRAEIQQSIAAMKAVIQGLQDQIKGLSDRLDSNSCHME